MEGVIINELGNGRWALDTLDLPDYKWYCFDGVPRYCQVINNRSTNETIDFFDTDWHHQEFVGLNPAAVQPRRPLDIEKQIDIARKLSRGIPFSRIDLYSIGNKTLFGEITLYQASGWGVFSPTEYNVILGQMLKLPQKRQIKA